MSSYTQSIQNLMNELARLPGIGTRSAERIAFHLLKQKPTDALKLADQELLGLLQPHRSRPVLDLR
jgi:recombination protein RecR